MQLGMLCCSKLLLQHISYTEKHTYALIVHWGSDTELHCLGLCPGKSGIGYVKLLLIQ